MSDKEDRAYAARLFAGRSRDVSNDELQPDIAPGNRVPSEGTSASVAPDAEQEEREYVRQLFGGPGY